MNRGSLAVMVLVTLIAVIPARMAAAEVVLAASDFSTDADGWTALAFAGGNDPDFTALFDPAVRVPTYLPAGGNLGGYVRMADPNDGWTYFSAPGKFLGNQSAAIDGILTFDLSDIPNGGTLLAPPHVALRSGSLVLVHRGGTAPALYPDWTKYAVSLTGDLGFWHVGTQGGAAATAAQMAAVLANLDGLFIMAEDRTPVVEEGALDNVQLVSAVPLPAAGILMGAALGLLPLVPFRRRTARPERA